MIFVLTMLRTRLKRPSKPFNMYFCFLLFFLLFFVCFCYFFFFLLLCFCVVFRYIQSFRCCVYFEINKRQKRIGGRVGFGRVQVPTQSESLWGLAMWARDIRKTLCDLESMLTSSMKLTVKVILLGLFKYFCLNLIFITRPETTG